MFEANRWRTLSAYLDQALDLASDDDRAAWLERLREREPDIARDLSILLDTHRAVVEERFLEAGPARPDPFELAGQMIGSYTLVAPIGEGGMGSVWLAERTDGRFHRRAAVKFPLVALAGRSEQRFRREGRILGRLTHPHIAALLDAGVSPSGRPFLVLEHVDGERIDAYGEQHGLDPAARIRLFLDVLDAVAYAHANLIVHRDIKPSNVLVDAAGQVKLLDFGIAKLLDDDNEPGGRTQLTGEGGSVLTPEYAAPEQITGGPVTTATDVYALGVLLYLLLTGHHPAAAALGSPAELVHAIVEVEPRRASDAAPEPRRAALRGDLDTIVARALKKKPEERYPSAAAFADDLRRFLGQRPIRARPDTFAYRAAKFTRRNRTAVALAVAASAASVAGVASTLISARAARVERDFAIRQLARAEAINDLNNFLLTDAAPSGKPFTVNDLLARAERTVARQRGGDEASRVGILVSIGRQYWSQDEDGHARRVLAQAYDLSRKLTDRSTRARASCALASALARGGELPRAEGLFNEGIRELPDQPQFDIDRIFCLERGHEVALESGAVRDSIDRALAARRLLARSPVQSELADVGSLMQVAEAYRRAGSNREAVAAFEQASSRLAEIGRDDTQQAGTLYNNWGVALGALGLPLEAERVLRRAIEIGRDDRAEETVSPMVLVNYARVLDDLGRTTDAANYVERGFTRAAKADDEVVMNQALLLRAAVYMHLGQLDRAAEMLDVVEPRLKRALPPGHLAFVALMSQRALLAAARGDPTTALDLDGRAIDLVEDAINKGGQGADALPVLLVRRSEVELTMNRPDQAVADAERALTLRLKTAPAASASMQSGRLYLALGKALAALGKTANARSALQSALDNLKTAVGPDHALTRSAQQLAAALASTK